MTPRRYDLHLHSTVSDGWVSPARVVGAARRAGLDTISLTDHDSVSGVADALGAAREQGVRVIPGTEISCSVRGAEVHLLAYGIDPDDEALRAHERRAVARRRARMEEMVRRLRESGVPVSMDEVEGVAAGASVLSRAHLARVLHEQGHAGSFRQAFERHIGRGCPGFVSLPLPSAERAIELAHAAGGVAAWAHPLSDDFEPRLSLLAGVGLDGVEAYRPEMPRAGVSRIESAARRHRLFVTGGSDWHGRPGQELGRFSVPAARLAGFLERVDVPAAG
ncbi:MAG: PHP domain-containing protein [Longimicrobiaceae bacterium]